MEKEIALILGITCEELDSLIGSLTVEVFFTRAKIYRGFAIDKKAGSNRFICEPIPAIKKMQKHVLKSILSNIPIHDAAHGFRRNRSIVTNAKPHLRKDVIFKIDLLDFFPSIDDRRIEKLFRQLHYSPEIARFFSLFLTVSPRQAIGIDLKEIRQYSRDRFLPQGSPTSPMLSNLICYDLDLDLTIAAENLGFAYTRYADDLTFSSSFSSLRQKDKLLKTIERVIDREGFKINQEKTQIFTRSTRQEVTGIIVNQKINLAKDKLKAFRAVLSQIEREGLEGKTWGNSSDTIAAITGFANYVTMVDPQKGKRFLEAIDRIQKKYRKSETSES